MKILRTTIRVASLLFAPVLGFAGFWTATCGTLFALGASDIAKAVLSFFLGLAALAVAVVTLIPFRIVRRRPALAIPYGVIGLVIAVLGSIWLYSASKETNYNSVQHGLFALAGCMLFTAPISLVLEFTGNRKEEPEDGLTTT